MSNTKRNIPKNYPKDRVLPGYPNQETVVIHSESFIPVQHPVRRCYLPQPNNWSCGPTSLLIACRTMGLQDCNLDQLIELSQTSPEIGTCNQQLVSVARDLLPHNEVLSGDGASVQYLKELLQEKYLVIVNFREPIDGDGHFAILSGISDTSIHILDPSAGPDCVLSLADFDHRSFFSDPVVSGWYLAIK